MAPQQLGRFLVERDELGRLDPVSPVHLLDHQLGIQINLEPVWFPIFGGLEAVKQGVVLGFVVGHPPEISVEPSEAHAALVLDHDADGGVARIAPGGAVREEPQDLQAITRMRPQFSHWTMASPLRSSCMPDDVTVTWHSWH